MPSSWQGKLLKRTTKKAGRSAVKNVKRGAKAVVEKATKARRDRRAKKAERGNDRKLTPAAKAFNSKIEDARRRREAYFKSRRKK